MYKYIERVFFKIKNRFIGENKHIIIFYLYDD